MKKEAAPQGAASFFGSILLDSNQGPRSSVQILWTEPSLAQVTESLCALLDSNQGPRRYKLRALTN